MYRKLRSSAGKSAHNGLAQPWLIPNCANTRKWPETLRLENEAIANLTA